MATIEQLNEREREFAAANGCDMARTLRGSLSFPTDKTFSVETIELDDQGRPLMKDGELVRTEIIRPIINHLPMPNSRQVTIEHNARIERSAYLPHTDQTEIVVRVKGELRPERGDVVVVTIREGAQK